MATGRTSPIFMKVQIEDSGGVLRDIPVLTVGDIGITYDEVDVSALQDRVKTVMDGLGSGGVTLTGPFDNTAAATASASGEASGSHLSGSHTVLEPLNGLGTPRAFGIYIGIQGDWASGDPVFGGADSVIVTGYTVDPAAGKYTAKLGIAGGGTIPAWGTSAITVPT